MSHTSGPPITKSTTQSLQEEISRLDTLQNKARALAVYVGMTDTEDQEYESRRKRILELLEEYEKLRGGSNEALKRC